MVRADEKRLLESRLKTSLWFFKWKNHLSDVITKRILIKVQLEVPVREVSKEQRGSLGSLVILVLSETPDIEVLLARKETKVNLENPATGASLAPLVFLVIKAILVSCSITCTL